MTRQERIHSLFNELHRELTAEATDSQKVGIGIALGDIASTIDAAHHDYTNITLEEIA